MAVLLYGLFVMAASCYLLFVTSEPLEEVGGRIGRLLHLPEDVIASTFQALATSGPEIVMAILAATTYIEASASWAVLTKEERGCSGCLNMCFSAMDNLLGIGCVGMIFMMWKKYINGKETVVVAPSVKVGLLFYIASSACLCLFIQLSSFEMTLPDTAIAEATASETAAPVAETSSEPSDGRTIIAHTMQVWQAWVLMGIGIVFVLSQFFLPSLLARRHAARVAAGLAQAIPDDEEDEDGKEKPLPASPAAWLGDLVRSGFIYAFLVFGLVVFVRECLGATFNIATLGIVSVGGVLIMLTSYVSSFPEFMMTYRYAVANKRNALLGMLFGSNVLDLAFAGYRAIHSGQPMDVYTTGRMQFLFPLYLWLLPAVAVAALIALSMGWFKYKHAYPLVVFYAIYIISGFVLL